MKYLITFLLAFCFSTICAHAQTGFERVYGGVLPDWFRTVISTSDGGIIAGGGTKSFGFGDFTNSDGYIVKMNGNGDTLWTRHFGEYPYNDVVYSIVENALGYLAAGFNVTDTPALSYEYYAVQYDVNGNKIWDRFYGLPGYVYCTDVITDNHGRNILAGSAYSSITSYDFYLVKTDAAGNKITEAIFTMPGYDFANAIIQTHDGGYAIAGYTNDSTPGYNIFVMKTDSNFNLQWQHNYGSTLDDFGYDIAEDSAKNLWILGSMETPDSGHMVLIKTDSIGENAFMKFPGTSPGDFGYKLQSLHGSGFLIGGITATLQKANEMLVERLDENGDTLWTRHFGGSQNESGLGITADSMGSILIAGETEGFGTDQFDAYLVKMDATGDIPCPDFVSFLTATDSVCEDEQLFFTNTTISSQQFLWSLNGDNFFTSVDANNYFPEPGLFDVTLTACNVSFSEPITVDAKPSTNFTYDLSGLTVNFTLNPGIDLKSITWNFGDNSGDDTTDTNPSHTYLFPGSYWVTVSVKNDYGCDSTYIEQIGISTGIEMLTTDKYELIPNPAHHDFSLQTTVSDAFPIMITVLNLSGRIVYEGGAANNDQKIFTEGMLPGIYFLRLQDVYGAVYMQKLEIE